MPTIQQLVRKGRTPQGRQDQGARTEGQPHEAWRVHPCVHHHPEEAELGTA